MSASSLLCSGLILILNSKRKRRLVAASPLAHKQLLLTKGDNNHIDDLELYQGLEWLERKHIVGKVRG